MGSRGAHGLWNRSLWHLHAWVAWILGFTLPAPGSAPVPELRGPSPARPSSPVAAKAPPGRFVHVVETTSVMSAALEQLNRQSMVLLLQRVTEDADERCRSLEDRLDEEARRRSALQAEIEALRLAVAAQEAWIEANRAPRQRRPLRNTLLRRAHRRGRAGSALPPHSLYRTPL